MKTFKKLFVIALLSLFLQPVFALGQTNTNSNSNFTKDLDRFAVKSGYAPSQANQNSVANTIGRIASVAISFTATIFLIIAIYSGIQWMTGGGSKDKIAEAKTRLTRAIGGFILISLAYIITRFVINTLGQ